jgi:hypothetical protein
VSTNAGGGDQIVVPGQSPADAGCLRGEQFGRRSGVGAQGGVAGVVAVEGGGDGVAERDRVIVGPRVPAHRRWCGVDGDREVEDGPSVRGGVVVPVEALTRHERVNRYREMLFESNQGFAVVRR